MPSSSARDQFCSLRGFAPYDRFFLYPTEVLLLWDFAVQSTASTTFLTRSNACKWLGRPRGVAPTGVRFEMRILQGSRKTPTQCVLWERGGAGAQGEGFSQENRANAPSADDGSRVTLAHWMKRHVSGRPHDVRTRPLSLILAAAKSSLLGRFFLYPTKAELLREPYGCPCVHFEIRGNRYNVFPLMSSAHRIKRHA